ncbi:MAG: Spy/CpxP family protein refolding chaperone [Rhizomicrobium sp.]
MQSRILVPIFASLMLSAAALAQDAPPTPPPGQQGDHRAGRMEFNKADMEKHRAEMCADRYAHAVGEFAYLETKLALSDKQKPAFDRWKSSMLAIAKAHSGECPEMKMGEHEHSLVDALKRHEKRMKERLADLQAQMPSLEALNATLNDEQKHILDRAAMHAMMERMHGMQDHMRGMGDRMMHHDGGPQGDIPPPPPAQ